MLATFIIGLREGLEAALIVGIIAAFLRKNGKSLVPMWAGVVLAVLLSIAVGVSLDLVEKALPQAAQEAMETVIGAIAVFFVTGMIVWMNTHARDMRRQIEAEAAQAMGQASAYALASMAFLAVLKEGFETSVFLLATFSAAQSALLAAAGAVAGIVVAVVIGWGIFAGGVRINLGRFFTATGTFLILVAAGLVVSALRTAHEAGWLNVGQQMTFNLSWLVVPGTVTSALLSGVLGIPADPRGIEVAGWLLYLVPVLLYLYWPASLRPRPAAARRLQWASAIACAVVGTALAAFYPRPGLHLPASAPVVAAASGDQAAPTTGTAQLEMSAAGAAQLRVRLGATDEVNVALPKEKGQPDHYNGFHATRWTVSNQSKPAGAPAQLTLDQLVPLSGGRIPIGLNPAAHPGPYDADWQQNATTTVWVANGVLLDAQTNQHVLVTLSGGGLTTPRTVAVVANGPGATGWAVADAYRSAVLTQLNQWGNERTEWQFWGAALPIALWLIALLMALRTRVRPASRPSTGGMHAGGRTTSRSA